MLNELLCILILLNKNENFETVTKLNIFLQYLDLREWCKSDAAKGRLHIWRFSRKTVKGRNAVLMLNEPLCILILLNKNENFETVPKLNIFCKI